MNVLNYSELLRNMNLATRSLIARVAIALNDMQLVVLPAKSETGDVIPNQFIFLEYTENGYKENERIAAEFEKQRLASKLMGGFDFSQVVGYQNGVVMPFELISKPSQANDIATEFEAELDGKESTVEPNAETAQQEKQTRKPKAKK